MKKAIILCAGEGTRLRPLTYSRPKPLLPVAGRPLLDWILDAVAQAGIEQVCVVISPGHERAMADHLKKDDNRGLEIELALQDPPLGLAHATSMGRAFAGEDPFLLYLGDNLVEQELGPFIAAFEQSDSTAALMVKPVEDPRAFGIVELQGDRVMRLIEKPPVPPSNLAIVGIYAFQPAIFTAINSIQPSKRRELEITDAIQYVADHSGKVTAQVLDGWWQDVGQPTSVLAANHLLLEQLDHTRAGTVSPDCQVTGEVTVGAGAIVEASRIIGPVLIGEESVVRGATIGPDVALGRACRIEGTSLSNSVINCRTTVVGFGQLRDSIIGTHCTLEGAGESSAEGLLLADRSVVKVT